MARTPQQAYAELLRREKERALLTSSAALLAWDERTCMPRGGASYRAEQLALLARLAHEMLTDPITGELLAEASELPAAQQANTAEAAVLREIRRAYERAKKLPRSLVEELARATTLGQQAWEQARRMNDFASFRPHLERIVQLKRQEAEAVGYETTPYNALLDEYEPGETAENLCKLFNTLRHELMHIIQEVQATNRTPRRDILERDYPVHLQEVFVRSAAVAIGFDFEAGRLDVTAHPFCTSIGPRDVRITTRYNPRHFAPAFFGVLHEVGHGLYEQGLEPEHFGTPLGLACSLGIHESQSRLWENQVGRSRPFWEHFFPRAQQTFLESLRDVTLDEFVFAINEVRPSLIRVEADEATYNLHILIRFELEQALVTGDLVPADLPGVWNERYRQYLNLSPPDDAQGCLQDIHWSAGLFGYFPTYTLGNLYAAQFMEKARQDLPQLDEQMRRGKFLELRDWLRENIHRHGQRYRAAELCRKVTGKTLSPEPFLSYLRNKYAQLYGIKSPAPTAKSPAKKR
ncbi:MAG: carboxypeptidase M32 [Gemmatales bacterium]|nr:carboxypeptidase M32 [Gemmatales bacterium]MDW7995078.1 carboxypeptidase M32 [Gemmatales bacterium]